MKTQSCSQLIGFKHFTNYQFAITRDKRPFARSDHKVQNKLCWDTNNTVGLLKQGKSGWTGKSSFVLEVPLCYLSPSIIYSVPCDWIVQRAYSSHIFRPVKAADFRKVAGANHTNMYDWDLKV